MGQPSHGSQKFVALYQVTPTGLEGSRDHREGAANQTLQLTATRHLQSSGRRRPSEPVASPMDKSWCLRAQTAPPTGVETLSIKTYVASMSAGRIALRMKELVSFLADLGSKNLKTYIQRGNVVFRSPGLSSALV